MMVNGMVGCTVKETKTEDDSKGKVEDVQESGKDADVPAEEDDSTVDVKNTQEPKAEDAANQQKITQTIKPEEEPQTVKAEGLGLQKGRFIHLTVYRDMNSVKYKKGCRGILFCML